MKDDLKENEAKEMPLEGIRIVEYAIFHAGPGGSAILGDLGADVIKVESWKGDPERYWAKVGPIDQSLDNGESFWFQVASCPVSLFTGQVVRERQEESMGIFIKG